MNRKEKILSKIPDYPQRIVIELTPLCNLSCPMCPRHYIDESDGFMTRMLWEKLIDEIKETSPDAIVIPFWRGESLLHPQFIEFMEYALDRSIRIHISTNGHVFDEKYAEVLKRCEFVTFSVHTPIAYSNAREFISLKNGSNPIVQVSFVSGEKSTGKILDTIISEKDLGGFNSVRLYEEHTTDGVFGKSGSSHTVHRNFCPKLIDTLVIAYDGSVSRCNHIWKTDNCINLNKLSIKDVWKSQYLYQIRENYPDNQCEPCDQWTGHTCGEAWRNVNGRIEHKVFNP